MSCRLSICIGAFQKRKTPLDDARGFWTRVGRKPKRVVNVEFQSAGQRGTCNRSNRTTAMIRWLTARRISIAENS